ncbi:MAG: Lrp/AsnC ligand binding domain-containing protein [Woeseiaceae bacterium]
MVSAIVLVKTEKDKTPQLAQEIADMKGVSEVFSVTGRYDLVVIVKVKVLDQIADVVSGFMRQIEGITETETLIAFRAFSTVEQNVGFDLGLD